MKNKLTLLSFGFLVACTTFVNNTVGDNTKAVVVSEIAWMGTKASSRDEWIELYNNSESQIDITSWVLKTTDEGFSVMLAGIIPAKSFYLIERNDDEVVKDVNADLVANFGNGFSNTGERVELYDSSGQLVDFVDAGGGWPQGKASPDYKTMERIDVNKPGVLENWKTNDGLTIKGIDAEDNLIQGTPMDSGVDGGLSDTKEYENAQLSIKIFLNEIFPNPQGSDAESEFIELYNADTADIELEGWVIEEGSGARYTIGKKYFSVTLIPSQGYFVLYRAQTKLSLNNSGGDAVKLLNPQGDVIDTISYTESAQEQKSFNLVQDTQNQWVWSETSTPGAVNIIKKTNQAPQAHFSFVQDGVKISVDASDSSDPENDESSYSWDFGDGEKGSGEIAEHAYSRPGKYTVVLEVSDGINVAKDSKTIFFEKVVEPNTYSREIVINEILPNPKGSDLANEWIELYNKGNEEVDLDGWMIRDSAIQSKYIIPEGTKIKQSSFLLLKREHTKIAINNTSDEVKLFQPDGSLLDSISFKDSAKEDYSYNRKSDGAWAWSKKITPGGENVVEIPVENNVNRPNDIAVKRIKKESVLPKKQVPLPQESKPVVYANTVSQEMSSVKQEDSPFLLKENSQTSELKDNTVANTHSKDVNVPLNASIATMLNSKDSALILVAITFAGFIGSVGGVVFSRKIK